MGIEKRYTMKGGEDGLVARDVCVRDHVSDMV